MTINNHIELFDWQKKFTFWDKIIEHHFDWMPSASLYFYFYLQVLNWNNNKCKLADQMYKRSKSVFGKYFDSEMST